MGIFDKVGSRISQAGDRAITRTREMADSVKLNSDISLEEKKMKEYYMALGEAFFKAHRDSEDPALIGPLGELIRTEERISDLKKRLKELKGAVECPSCGSENERGASFCVSCGTKLPELKAAAGEETKMCPHCGAEITAETKFCTECGKRIEETKKPE